MMGSKGRGVIRSFLALIIVVAVVAAASTASGCVGGSGSGEKNWLELVPANAVAAAVFDVSTVKEKAVQDVLKNLTLYKEYLQFRQEVLNDTGIDIETLQRAIFVVNDVDSNDYTIPDIALYVEGKLDTEKFESKIKESGANLTKTTYSGVTLYYYPEDNSAVAFTSSYIIAGSKSVVEQIIDLKKGKGNWAKQYSDIAGKAGSGNLVAVADARYFAGKMGLNKPGEGKAGALIRPIEDHMKYVALRLNVGSEKYSVRVIIEADDEDGAQMIAKSVNAGIAHLESNLTRITQVVGNVTQLKTEIELLNSISVKQDGSFVSIGLDVTEKQLEELASMELTGSGVSMPRDTVVDVQAEEIEQALQEELEEQLENSTTEIQITTTSPNFGG